MRFIGKILLLMAFLWVGGFFVFTATLPREDKFNLAQVSGELKAYDQSEIGIVALTGGAGARIERALTLYEEGIADRVLISGTHPDVTKADLAHQGEQRVLDCCVDLGTRARTTVGNGIETRDWAKANQYRALLLVTNDFHLPRATVELKSVTEDVLIIGVPVKSQSVPHKNWYREPNAWRMLSIEYTKFLLSSIRTLL